MAKFMHPDPEALTEFPSELPILPLRNTLAYPTMVLPLAVGIPRSIRLIEEALEGDRLIGLVGMEDGSIEEPGPDQVWQTGTIAKVHRVVRQGDAMQVIVQGIERFTVVDWLEPKPYLRAVIEPRADISESDLEMDALMRTVREIAREVVSLSPHLPDEVTRYLNQVDDPRRLLYLVVVNARMAKEEGQAMLEVDDVKEKLLMLIRHLSREKDLLSLEQKIQTEAHEEMDKAQRDYFLRQQLKAIRKELGEEEEAGEVIDEYREKIRKSGMPAEARKETVRELKRLDGMPPQAAEYSLIKGYVDWMVDIPWKKRSEDRLEIDHARKVLDEDHYDLAEVKTRILEFLAVRKLISERELAETKPKSQKKTKVRRKKAKAAGPVDEAKDKTPTLPVEDIIGVFAELPDDDMSDIALSEEIFELTEPLLTDEEDEPTEKKLDFDDEEPGTPEEANKKSRTGTILCFAGPPGVGKTSLGQSIARALGRKFTRMSLGGMRDEAEIRGHRRTYIGALPGRIIQGIKRAGTRNPVFMLDEVDKIGADWRGDPASALLEVLDPAQNHAFRDHYLDVDFDLSDVMFIATANNLETIPEALRDRMEIITIEGYTDHDKLKIAELYLVPRQVETNGLRPKEIEFGESSLKKIIHDYTRESGVRELERQIGTICRKAAVVIASKKKRKIKVTAKSVREQLKTEKYLSDVSAQYKIPGVATGLAVTAGGGDILYIEATRMKGKGALTLTGQLGDVMKESAQIAFNYVRSKAGQWGIDPDLYEKTDVHVHVPAGATPKDGPSAGVAMVAATVSLLTGRMVRREIGMTGEVTLRGRVLPVGGVKAKVLAAHRAGLETVIIPKRNEPDLEELPQSVKDSMRFVGIDLIDEGLKEILEPALAVVSHGSVKETKPKRVASKRGAIPAGGAGKRAPNSRRS